MKKSALWLVIPWALFAAAAIGWVIYWHVVAGAAEARIAALIAAENAKGAQVAVARILRHGFPALMRLELQGLSYAPARGSWSATSARADLHIALTNPQHVKLEAKAPIEVSRANGAVTRIAADALIASLRSEGGALAAAGVEATNLTLDDPAAEGVLAARTMVANLRPDPRAAGEYQLALELGHLTLPRPVRSFEAFGLELAALRAAIVIEQGSALLNAGGENPLASWREAEGTLRFEALGLEWGPLQAQGSGHGGLDDQRRLAGALTLPIERPAPVFNALANGPNVNENTRRALGLLAAGYALSGDDITLDVEAKDGVLRLEGLGVRLLPPVY